MLAFSGLRGQDAQALGYILKGGQHLLSLIDEVLDLLPVEGGEMRLELSSVDAVALTKECTHLLARLRVNVTDTGPGIAPERVARLFVPFERLQHESGEMEGTGLVVSRRVAEAMDGTVDGTSEVGRGGTFWIELPLAAAPAAPPGGGGHLPGAPAPPPPTPNGAALLYIEDNLSNLRVMEMLLGRQRPGWRFLSARDGREGLEQARQSLPAAILLDLQLPGISGEEVLERLRGDPATRAISVIVLSADATAHGQERLLARGATEYVSKPFEVAAQLALLDRVLRHEKEPARKRS